MAPDLCTVPKGILIQSPHGYEKPLGFGNRYKTVNLTKLRLAIHCAEALKIVQVTLLMLLQPRWKCKPFNLLFLSSLGRGHFSLLCDRASSA